MPLGDYLYTRFSTKFFSGVAAALRLTGTGSLAVAQVEAARQEATRAGRTFILGNSAAITGIQSVQALVTTSAQWALWNADAGRAYILEELGVYLTSGTPGVGGTLWACLFTVPVQSGSSTAGVSISSTSNGGLSSKMVVKSAVTISAPAAPNWYPIASNPSPNVTAFASSTFLEHRSLQGGWIIPPGQGLGLAVVTPAGTSPLFAPFARWGESELDLE